MLRLRAGTGLGAILANTFNARAPASGANCLTCPPGQKVVVRGNTACCEPGTGGCWAKGHWDARGNCVDDHMHMMDPVCCPFDTGSCPPGAQFREGGVLGRVCIAPNGNRVPDGCCPSMSETGKVYPPALFCPDTKWVTQMTTMGARAVCVRVDGKPLDAATRARCCTPPTNV